MRNPTLILVDAIGLTLAASLAAAGRSPKTLHYAADGSVALPDYRKWVFLGTGLGLQYTEQANRILPSQRSSRSPGHTTNS
jgi:hypothetical protein